MNLKEVKDSLRRHQGKWIYNSFKYETRLDLEDGGIRPIQGGVGKSKNGDFYKLLKVVNSESKEPATADEIQELLKHHWDEIKGNSQLFSDLYDRFYRVLALNLDRWKKVYNDPDTITVSLKIIKSSSDLAQEFCETVPDTVISGVKFEFSLQEAFKKGENPTFSREDYKKFLMTKAKNPMSEEKAEKASKVGQEEWEAALARARSNNRSLSASQDFPPERRTLLDYAKDYIVRTDAFGYDGMVDIVVDDFVTTGTTLKHMVSDIAIKDGTAIGVALFTK